MRASIGVVAVCGVWALGCSGLAPKTYAIDQADRDAFLEAKEVVEGLGIELPVDPAKESWTKTRSFDGAWEVEYEYESDELYVMHSVFVDTSESDAKAVYVGLKFGMSMADAGEDGFDLVEVDDLMLWGDQQQCSKMVTSGIDFGVMCVAQKGKRSMLLSFTGLGVNVDGKGSVDALLGERLALIEAYEPSQTEVKGGSTSGGRR